jgi:hypothetical protein
MSRKQDPKLVQSGYQSLVRSVTPNAGICPFNAGTGVALSLGESLALEAVPRAFCIRCRHSRVCPSGG